MKDDIDYSLYFNSKTWQLSKEQTQEVIEKMLLYEKLKKLEKKEVKDKKKKI